MAEATVAAAGVNANHGLKRKSTDIQNAIQKLLEVDRIGFSKNKFTLDSEAIMKAVKCSSATYRRATEEIRKELTDARDFEVKRLNYEGISQREIQLRTGVSQKTISRILSESKRSLSKMTQNESEQKAHDAEITQGEPNAHDAQMGQSNDQGVPKTHDAQMGQFNDQGVPKTHDAQIDQSGDQGGPKTQDAQTDHLDTQGDSKTQDALMNQEDTQGGPKTQDAQTDHLDTQGDSKTHDAQMERSEIERSEGEENEEEPSVFNHISSATVAADPWAEFDKEERKNDKPRGQKGSLSDDELINLLSGLSQRQRAIALNYLTDS